MTERKTHRAVQIIALIAVLLAVNAFLGFSLAQESERAITDQIRARMTDLACSAAALLDGDVLATITPEDQGTPKYESAMKTLHAFSNNVDIAFIYCVRKVGDKEFEITIDPADEPAGFGELTTYTAALDTAARGTPTVDLVAYEDRWGRFYSAYCPVFDSSGNVASVVGVDFAASWYEQRAESINRMALFNGIASLILALIAIGVVARMSRTENRYVRSMLQANRFDQLTGLANMSFFFVRASKNYEKLVSKGERPVMLYIDLIGLKYFNQKRGFAEGDNLLKAFADLLSKYFGHECCGRMGQDHFAVSTSEDELDKRLDAFIEECARINGGKSLPVRIGIHPDSLDKGVGAATACDRAKIACELNKAVLTSSYTYFNAEMLEQVELDQYIISNLDKAIAEGWIKVFYQPIVRASTGKVCDEEALARWDDPVHGVLMPAEFIPVLEDAMIAYKLDLCVLEQTLKKMQHMADVGLFVVSASINLSRSDFETCDIVEEVRARVDESGISRSKVNIEITETAIGRDFEFMSEQIDRLHALGFQVWMDDFGSEYSSLDYLQRLQFDLIKLDMRFMQQFDSGDKSRIILTELVRMAFGLGIDTVAEGVETQEQVDFLREIGCSQLQGYYFTKPLSLDAVLKRYEDGTAIGFENPDEAGYYAALGRANLYDLSSIVRDFKGDTRRYFDSLPMAVVESTRDDFTVLRCNASYMEFISSIFGSSDLGERVSYESAEREGPNAFVSAIRVCSQERSRMTVDDTTLDGMSVHAFIRHIATNPVTESSALVIAVLDVVREQEE